MKPSFVLMGLGLASLLIAGCSPSSPSSGGSGSMSSGSVSSASGGGAVQTSSPDDAAINSAVKAKLAADPMLKGEKIVASTAGAQVQLTGTVKTTAVKDEVEKDVMETVQPAYSKDNAGLVDNIMVGTGS